LQPLLDLIGEDRRIARSVKNLLREASCGGMVSVTVRGTPYEDRGDDQWAREADNAYDIIEDSIVAPFLQGLIEGLREAIISRDGEILAGAIIAVGLKQFLSANEAKGIP